MYGNQLYGILAYAQNADSGGDAKEHYVDLFPYVPPFMAEIRELAEIYRTQGYALGELEYLLNGLFQQLFVPTATWGLAMWEDIARIDTNLQQSYEQRRAVIYAKLRGQETCTVAFLEDLISTLAGGETQVIEHNAEYRFTVQFVGFKGIPRNLLQITQLIEELKPAHLAYDYGYTYTTWAELKDKRMTWGRLNAAGTTWTGVRTMEVVK